MRGFCLEGFFVKIKIEGFMMKYFKLLFFGLALSLLYCGGGVGSGGRAGYEDPYAKASGASSKRDRREDRRGNLENSNSRSAEIRRLRGPERVISSELKPRFDGGFYYEGFGGPDCRESEACEAICDTAVPRGNRGKCYKSPKALVEKLEDGFFDLLNIGEVESVKISPGLIAGMLDINVDLVADLVEDRMSEGDLKSFLAWVALNEGVAEVFLEEDRRSEVMKKAFRELGKLQDGAKQKEETGLNMGLIQNEDSFFYLAAVDDNEAAFQIGYKILRSACRTKDCKLNLLCAREKQERSRSRIFGYRSNALNCRTSADPGRRSRREATCYIHGSATWSYLDELIEDDEIRDNDFEGDGKRIDVKVCNNYCGSETSSKKCQKVQ